MVNALFHSLTLFTLPKAEGLSTVLTFTVLTNLPAGRLGADIESLSLLSLSGGSLKVGSGIM